MVGTVPAGTTAYTIPKIDDHLKEQGFDKEVRDITLLALSVGIGATVGGDTASTANNVGQVQWNYLSHTELSAWKTSLIKCSGNQQCIDNVNTEYNNLNKINFNTFENYCTINFDAQRCSNLISRFQNGTQGDYNLKHLPALYTDISRLGGTNASGTINSVKINNATGGYLIRDTGINNINRHNGKEIQALVGELANERLYGGGRGGTVAGNGASHNNVVNRGDHANQRRNEGRPTGTFINDVQKARDSDFYYDNATDRYIVRGSNAREHVFEKNGQHVTTVTNRTSRDHSNRLRRGRIRTATQAEIESMKSVLNLGN